MLFTVRLAVSGVVFVVWVLDAALAVVSEEVVAGFAAIVDCDVVAERGGLGCKERGWGCNCGADSCGLTWQRVPSFVRYWELFQSRERRSGGRCQ
jgi:hypothetical protein